MAMNETIEIHRAADRFSTELDWLQARHSFSFGSHYNPGNVGHGLLIVSNEDRIAPGGGFGPHPHADMEIVTWVLQGALEHQDSKGNHGVLRPGLAQRMSAGSGITHAETNASTTEPVHLVQMWVVPDSTGIEPSYEDRDFSEDLTARGLIAVASGQGHGGAMPICQRGAVMWVGRLVDNETVEIPDAPFVHLFVAKGTLELNSSIFEQGDAARLVQAGTQLVTSVGESEVIIWETQQEANR